MSSFFSRNFLRLYSQNVGIERKGGVNFLRENPEILRSQKKEKNSVLSRIFLRLILRYRVTLWYFGPIFQYLENKVVI